MIRSNYYASSFFWSTIQKILNAILGFISIPLLLGYYGKAEYGILAIATACNGYMSLLDLGMNTGAVKYFSQWEAEGKKELIYRVAQTNISFYFLIACINSIILICLGLFGEHLFSITHEQFLKLRTCLFIIAAFSIFSWGTTTFNQLLISNRQIAYTMQVQCTQILLKALLIFIVLWKCLPLTVYFFGLTAITSFLLFPYAIKCKKQSLINSIRPAFYWKDFKVVAIFSLSIFTLSLFQMTATQSRPILLGIFSTNGAETVSEFRIIEVIPQLIIMIGSTFSSIFLPKTSEIIAKKNDKEIKKFAYKWTTVITIIASVLCFPFILSAKEILTAFVGNEFQNLSVWLIIWVVCTLLQIHSSPINALILAYGKVKILVLTSAISCIISMIINALLAPKYGVGSAIIGYACYILIVLCINYLVYYRKIMKLSLYKILLSFSLPTLCGCIALIATYFIFSHIPYMSLYTERLDNIIYFSIKCFCWLILFITLILSFRIVKIAHKKITIFNE